MQHDGPSVASTRYNANLTERVAKIGRELICSVRATQCRPSMTNLMALTDRLIEATGLDGADVRLRARYLREAGLLPNAPRGSRSRSSAPQIEALHATLLLLGCLAAGPQLRAPEAVRALWALPMAAQSGLLQRHDQTVEQRPAYATQGMGLSFGQVLLSFM